MAHRDESGRTSTNEARPRPRGGNGHQWYRAAEPDDDWVADEGDGASARRKRERRNRRAARDSKRDS